MSAPLTDTHVHVWDLTGGPYGVSYPWLTSGPLHRTHRLAEVEEEMADLGVTRIVLVQASDQLAETDELLRAASAAPVGAAVVGWLPLADAAATAAELDRRQAPELVGVRHLIHDEPDPEWMLRPEVAGGMGVLESRELTFDAVAERPDLVAQLPRIAARHPELRIILDHLGKPPVAAGWRSEEARLWVKQVADVARYPNVAAKLSGLATVSGPRWRSQDWRPYVHHALETFGPERLLLGSDWPVSTLAGGYTEIMTSQLEVIAELSVDEQRLIRHENAAAIYRLAVPES